MLEVFVELFAELLPLAAYGTAALLLTGLGIVTEKGGLAHLSSGDGTLGMWMLFMGTVFLYLGIVLLGYGEFLKRLVVYARST